nr:MAG TPA: hypothetical protein [Caudoviricetes sp.]
MLHLLLCSRALLLPFLYPYYMLIINYTAKV